MGCFYRSAPFLFYFDFHTSPCSPCIPYDPISTGLVDPCSAVSVPRNAQANDVTPNKMHPHQCKNQHRVKGKTKVIVRHAGTDVCNLVAQF